MRKLFISLILFLTAATSFAWSGTLDFVKGNEAVKFTSDGVKVCLQEPHTYICSKNITISDYFFLSPDQKKEFVIRMMEGLGYTLRK